MMDVIDAWSKGGKERRMVRESAIEMIREDIASCKSCR